MCRYIEERRDRPHPCAVAMRSPGTVSSMRVVAMEWSSRLSPQPSYSSRWWLRFGIKPVSFWSRTHRDASAPAVAALESGIASCSRSSVLTVFALATFWLLGRGSAGAAGLQALALSVIVVSAAVAIAIPGSDGDVGDHAVRLLGPGS